MEMRRCKECGKLFKPKGREQYCSDIHYRPCPICGTPVEVKYLSDPPRRCANCKANRIVQHVKPLIELKDIPSTDIIEKAKESNEPTTPSKSLNEPSVSIPTQQLNIDELPPGKDIRRFIGKDYKHGKGFIPNHLYELVITKDEYSYWITATYDWTDNCSKEITELFSSMISINGHFEKLDKS